MTLESEEIQKLLFEFRYHDVRINDYIHLFCNGMHWTLDDIPQKYWSWPILRKIKLFAIVSIFYCMQKRSTKHQFEQFCQAFDVSSFHLDSTFDHYTPDQILAIENYLAG